MLEHSFCHLRGIGPKTERQLWTAGLSSWGQVRAAQHLTSARRARLLQGCQESQRRLAASDAAWFAERLPSRERWRLFATFQHSVAYLDIETTGLDSARDHVTTVAVYDGRRVHVFVHGQNLDALPALLDRYQLLVTYNGATFDLPFLRRSLGLSLEQAHIDLRYVLSSLGYSGGLKACERALGLDRQDLADVDGFMAVLLWHEYRRSADPRVLQTLLAYNVADVLNLALIMPMAVNKKLRDTPFHAALRLPQHQPAANPYQAWHPIIERLQRHRW